MTIQSLELIQLVVTLIPILTIAWKGSSMLTRLEEMVHNLNKCIEEIREDREKDKQEFKEIQKNHELRIGALEKEIILVKENIHNEH